ncbi:putative transcriptional regulatory C3C7.04-like protein [Cladobotryum mycophilum]|uniref:Transcriptional regulatory C3C7.04-like protein n=1 Tax=Cladobotryum mycophilum TaxID=491253 RepID=A0ABR0SQB7_9HYPO
MSNPPDQATRGARRQRRPRAIIACDTCRTCKVKCDGTCPCSHCIQHSFECTFNRRVQVVHIPSSRTQPTRVSTTGPTTASQIQASASGVHIEQTYRPLRPSNDRLPSTPPVHTIDSAPRPSLVQATNDVTINETESVSSTDREIDREGLEEINEHTKGSEFYGPTGTFYFLSRLRSQANLQRFSGLGNVGSQDLGHRNHAETSVVNLLHSSDYSETASPSQRHSASPHVIPSSSSARNLASSNGNQTSSIEVEIERECARLYFQNLHCVHPILDQQDFLARCEREVWTKGDAESPAAFNTATGSRGFLALFYSVLAVGALVAGDTSILMWKSTLEFINQVEQRDDSEDLPYPPIRVAKLFFDKGKLHLGDVFESTSFETSQALFIMGVFCQSALKPHSCYMYSGMAIRTALAIGIPTGLHSRSQQQSLLWWALYSHEIEMCSSAGRQSLFGKASQYKVELPKVSNVASPSLLLVNCMVDLAEIIRSVGANSAQPNDRTGLSEKATVATQLERRLVDWKSSLPLQLNFEISPLDENELVTKQKIVLKLRFLYTNMLIHRQFLMSAATLSTRDQFSRNILSCVKAAREAIYFVHTTYQHRPYFRTWFYNTTYILDASMVLLYVILSNASPFPVQDIISDVEKSLEIFAAMKMLAVARRCAEVIKDVLDVAKRFHGQAHKPMEQTDNLNQGHTESEQDQNLYFGRTILGLLGMEQGLEEVSYSNEELYANLVDPNLVFNFLNFEDWNASSGPSHRGILVRGESLNLRENIDVHDSVPTLAMATRKGPFRLVTVNTAPERAKRLIGRMVDALGDEYDITHVSNCKSIDEVVRVVTKYQPNLLFSASMWTPEEVAQIQALARSVNPDIKVHAIPTGLQVKEGPDAIVDYLVSNVPLLLGSWTG